MVIRSNSSFYGLPLGMFVAGIVVGTAVSIWRADFLYRQIICSLPAVHLQIQQTGFPSGFLLFVCRLRLPVFLLMAISIFSGFSLLVFSGTAFISGASAAVVITSATMLTGMVGILQALALFGVHSLFYLFGYWALYELAGKRRGFTFGEQIGILIRIAGVWAAGMGGGGAFIAARDYKDASLMKSPRPCGASLLWTWYSARFDRKGLANSEQTC